MSAHKAAAWLALCFVAAGGTAGWSQVVSGTILEIEVENLVQYSRDVTDLQKLATDPNRTTATAAARNFAMAVVVADIVAVNGKPAKGTWVSNQNTITLRLNPSPGQGIADTVRNVISNGVWEILQSDGTPIGSIMISGMGFGPLPPGAPTATAQGNFTITGGTGAFLGVHGQSGGVPAPRQASMTEDPANRRIHGGSSSRSILNVIPMTRPEIVIIPSGPAVVHANDFSAVTTAKPARSGEILSMIATNLGPTRPGVNPGQPFPGSPPHVVNSPVEVTVNGQPAEVLYAGGYPGTTNTYQVNFRLPSGVAPGQATLQLAAAWIGAPEVRVAVQ